ncbi:MAG: potassium channel family protein [Capsulimonadales bacterium]|nr:potassium channel family protein [Capsulimonadales bacterium]
MRIFIRALRGHYLLTVFLLGEMLELAVAGSGPFHHLFDAVTFIAICLLLGAFGCPVRPLVLFGLFSGAGWVLDLLNFRQGPIDIEGLCWLLAHSIIGYSLIRSLKATTVVTEAEITNAISLFLVMGIMFANIYALILWNFPGALISTTSKAVQYDQILYFSFMTQTTVGFGDIVPGNGPVRLISVLQAIAGIMYVAIILSRFVSLYSTGHRPVRVGTLLSRHRSGARGGRRKRTDGGPDAAQKAAESGVRARRRVSDGDSPNRCR